ncbi:hypothetical protein [Amycolatopsis sp. NPDC051903]|uniref:hypothetical protein n=1 Tax=Amycolatopsis sp. NPDC051903 TaxID=3363936 RepID=UPI0037A35B5A
MTGIDFDPERPYSVFTDAARQWHGVIDNSNDTRLTWGLNTREEAIAAAEQANDLHARHYNRDLAARVYGDAPILLPENATATDVIDLLSGHVLALVRSANADKSLTEAQFAEVFLRTFAVALPTFLDKLRKSERPELAEQLAWQFLAEEGARRAAGQ